MTLRVRLAVMMVLLLVVALALQYLLMERDRRATMAELGALGSGLDATTAQFVESAWDLTRRPGKERLDDLLRTLPGPGPLAGGAQVRVLVWSDTAEGSVRHEEFLESVQLDWIESPSDSSSSPGREARSHPRGVEGPDSVYVQTFRQEGRHLVVETVVGGDSHSHALADSLLARVREERIPAGWTESAATEGGGPAGPRLRLASADDTSSRWIFSSRLPLGPAGTHDVVVNLPVPGAPADSFFSLQVRYPLDAIQEELAAQRRAGILWLGAVLGLGVLGAFFVAGRFTRPIRALETSFRRVEEGDLTVRVEPERTDEIGRLTGSFNEMVERLRESREVERRLGEAERLATVGRLAAGMAHEIRNPLNAIQLTARQMRDVAERGRAPDDPTRAQLERYCGLVAGEVQRLDRLVTAFLDLSRESEIAPLLLDGVASLSASVELFRPEAEVRGIRIDLETDGPVPILADPVRLPAVWNNLLANALAASPDDATLRVRAEQDADGTPTDQPSFVVQVEDEGPGVAEADRVRIFEPFFSGRPTGTGLGLAIARAVVERHGGSLELRPSASGAVFAVRIPVAAGGMDARSVGWNGGTSPDGSGRNDRAGTSEVGAGEEIE